MSKTIDTLIEDIYTSLEPLTNGEAIDVSDDLIEEFGEAIKQAFIGWARPTPRDSNFNLRMSNIGKPLRRLWYDSRAEGKDGDLSPSLMIKFLYGHLLEELVLLLVKISGHEVTSQQKEIAVDSIAGHMDCKIDGEVVDVKTASSFAFSKFKYGTLAENDPFGYLSQLAGYEAAEGTNSGGFLVINKESGELCLFIPEDLDKPNIKDRINVVKDVIATDSPPERCYPVEADGAKGNEKISKNCSYCSYKYDCYADANGGRGLRTFKYAKGLVHLTKVVVPPNVEEVL